MFFKGEIMFINNTGRQSGAISAYNSDLYFEGNVSFIGNSADSGTYTLILFSIQWLQMFSHYKLFCWINMLKPLFDAYTAPTRTSIATGQVYFY